MLLQVQEQMGITPPALESKPVLSNYQAWLVDEFGKLSRDRRYTESGPLPLHTGAMHTYWKVFQLQYLEFDSFYTWMTAIDGIWLDEVAKKRKKTETSTKNAPKPSPKKRR